MKKTWTPRRRRKSRIEPLPFRKLIVAHSYSALGDESYGIIQRCVDETLKDPELREKIDRLTREILKAILAKL